MSRPALYMFPVFLWLPGVDHCPVVWGLDFDSCFTSDRGKGRSCCPWNVKLSKCAHETILVIAPLMSTCSETTSSFSVVLKRTSVLWVKCGYRRRLLSWTKVFTLVETGGSTNHTRKCVGKTSAWGQGRRAEDLTSLLRSSRRESAKTNQVEDWSQDAVWPHLPSAQALRPMPVISVHRGLVFKAESLLAYSMVVWNRKRRARNIA